MTAPKASAAEGEIPSRAKPSAPLSFSGPPPAVIQKRRDFLAASRAKRCSTKSMITQARDRGDDGPPRVGYTCSKKVGDAVRRNRAKRRLREAARAVIPQKGRVGWDYVLIGRADVTAVRPFADLVGDLEYALKRLHDPNRP